MSRSLTILIVLLGVAWGLNAPAQSAGDGAPLVAIEAQATAIFERSQDAIVRIRARANVESTRIRRRPDLPAYRVGTGFLIDKKGWVVTTASNVDDADEVVVEWKGRQYACIPLGTDLYTNFAMLRIDAGSEDSFPELPLGDSDTLKAASFVMVLGFPYDLKVASSWGNVGGLDARRAGKIFPVVHIRSNVKVSPGQGGGPLLNSKGEVVGMLVAATQLDDATYSLPVNAIKKLKEDFINDGHARYGWSGLSAKDQDIPLDQHGNTERRPVISAISPNSPAATADLKIGDVILEVEGHRLHESADILNLLFFKQDGDALNLKIRREGETRELTLKLAERPADFVPYQRRERQPSPFELPSPTPKTMPATAPPPR